MGDGSRPGERTGRSIGIGVAWLLVAFVVALLTWPAAPVAARTETWAEAWRVGVQQVESAEAVVAPGAVYLADRATVQKIDADDGRTLWSHALDAPIAAGMALAGDVLVAADRGGRLTALDSGDGGVRWSADGFGQFSGRPLFAGGSLVVNARADRGGLLVALDPATGDERWRADLGPGTFGAPVAAGGVVAVTGEDAETSATVVLAFDAATGMPRWRTDPAARAFVRAAGRYLIFVSSGTDGALVAIDPAGREIWRYDPGPVVWSVDPPVERDGVLYLATGIGANSRQPPTLPQPGVVALDATTGDVLWWTVLEGGAGQGPAVSDDVLAVLAGGPPAPVLLDRATGEVVGVLPVPSGAQPRAVAADGGLVLVAYRDVVAGSAGRIVAYLRADGGAGTTNPAPFHLDPSALDVDGDRLADGEAAGLGTDRAVPDADGDEIASGSNPANPASPG